MKLEEFKLQHCNKRNTMLSLCELIKHELTIDEESAVLTLLANSYLTANENFHRYLTAKDIEVHNV